MEKELKELLIILEVLVAHHRELISSEQKKIEMIINQDWRGLQRQIEWSSQILRSIEHAERMRLELFEKLGAKKDSTMTDLADYFPQGLKKKFLKSGRDLVALVTELKNMNRNIERLLEGSLEIINFSLSLFSGAGKNGKTYSGSGEEKNTEGKYTSWVFDLKV